MGFRHSGLLCRRASTLAGKLSPRMPSLQQRSLPCTLLTPRRTFVRAEGTLCQVATHLGSQSVVLLRMLFPFVGSCAAATYLHCMSVGVCHQNICSHCFFAVIVFHFCWKQNEHCNCSASGGRPGWLEMSLDSANAVQSFMPCHDANLCHVA